jgi:hypothetical protein
VPPDTPELQPSETLWAIVDEHAMRFGIRRQAKDDVIDWFWFYNYQRLHSTPGCLSPIAFGKKQLAEKGQLEA